VFPSLPIPRLQATVEEQLRDALAAKELELEATNEDKMDLDFALEVADEDTSRL
jgi:hypothetical protein